MHRRGPHPALAMPLIECDREQDIRRLRPAVGHERVVRGPLKIGIVEVHIRKTVAGRRQINQPSSAAKQRRDPVHQHKVAQMIRPKLRLEMVRGATERGGHHSGIGDDQIERRTLGQQGIGASAHAAQHGQIELHQLKTSAVLRCRFPPYRGSCGFGLGQIPRRAYHVCAMRHQCSRRLYSDPGRNAGDQNSFPMQIDSGQNFIGRRGRAK